MIKIEDNINDKRNYRVRRVQRQYYRLKKQAIRVFVLLAISILLLVGGNKYKNTIYVTYSPVNRISYTVHLKDNDYYDEKTMPENMQYIGVIIDYIDVDMKSNFNINTPSDLEYKYSINGYITVAEATSKDRKIYEKKVNLLSEKSGTATEAKSFAINENLKIKYDQYNEMMKKFKSEYSLSADSSLIIEMSVNVTAKAAVFDNKFSTSYTSKITIPLTNQRITIAKNENNTSAPIERKEMHKSPINTVFFVGAGVFGAISFVLLIGLLKYLKDMDKTITPYENAVNKILREYDSAIVQVKETYDFTGITQIEVRNLEDLLDMHNNTAQPIICTEVWGDNEYVGDKTIFFIKKDKEAYTYTISRKKEEYKEEKGRP